jgi:hypothetical protein
MNAAKSAPKDALATMKFEEVFSRTCLSVPLLKQPLLCGAWFVQ